MPSLDEMIAAAIAEGRITKISAGRRALPAREAEAALGKIRAESCGSGHRVAPRPSLSSMDDDRS